MVVVVVLFRVVVATIFGASFGATVDTSLMTALPLALSLSACSWSSSSPLGDFLAPLVWETSLGLLTLEKGLAWVMMEEGLGCSSL